MAGRDDSRTVRRMVLENRADQEARKRLCNIGWTKEARDASIRARQLRARQRVEMGAVPLATGGAVPQAPAGVKLPVTGPRQMRPPVGTALPGAGGTAGAGAGGSGAGIRAPGGKPDGLDPSRLEKLMPQGRVLGPLDKLPAGMGKVVKAGKVVKGAPGPGPADEGRRRYLR